jgi:ADP-heptose:LPS heptosyltransferase
MKYCESFVVIDSFLNHLSAAFDKKGVVLFGGTSPERLGYKHNVNLIKDKCACPERPCHISDFASHLGKWRGCDYDYDCMKITAETVFEKLKEILKTR